MPEPITFSFSIKWMSATNYAFYTIVFAVSLQKGWHLVGCGVDITTNMVFARNSIATTSLCILCVLCLLYYYILAPL